MGDNSLVLSPIAADFNPKLKDGMLQMIPIPFPETREEENQRPLKLA
jgi:hypothetical protein